MNEVWEKEMFAAEDAAQILLHDAIRKAIHIMVVDGKQDPVNAVMNLKDICRMTIGALPLDVSDELYKKPFSG